jgi:hypothetical protein
MRDEAVPEVPGGVSKTDNDSLEAFTVVTEVLSISTEGLDIERSCSFEFRRN